MLKITAKKSANPKISRKQLAQKFCGADLAQSAHVTNLSGKELIDIAFASTKMTEFVWTIDFIPKNQKGK